MQIKYKVIEINEADHAIVVRFYTDTVTEESLAIQFNEDGTVARGRTDYSINVPIPAPVGAELEAFIMRHCPTYFFTVKEAVADPNIDTSLSSFKVLLGTEQVRTV